jgi:hypothetical protein
MQTPLLDLGQMCEHQRHPSATRADRAAQRCEERFIWQLRERGQVEHTPMKPRSARARVVFAKKVSTKIAGSSSLSHGCRATRSLAKTSTTSGHSRTDDALAPV